MLHSPTACFVSGVVILGDIAQSTACFVSGVFICGNVVQSAISFVLGVLFGVVAWKLTGVKCSDEAVDVGTSDWCGEETFFIGVDVPAGEKWRHSTAVLIYSAAIVWVGHSSVTSSEHTVWFLWHFLPLCWSSTFFLNFKHWTRCKLLKPVHKYTAFSVSSLAFWIVTADVVWPLLIFTSLA